MKLRLNCAGRRETRLFPPGEGRYGCAGAVGPRLAEATRLVAAELPGVPMVGFCTFGEQGHVDGIGNVHSNLSVLIALLG